MLRAVLPGDAENGPRVVLSQLALCLTWPAAFGCRGGGGLRVPGAAWGAARLGAAVCARPASGAQAVLLVWRVSVCVWKVRGGAECYQRNHSSWHCRHPHRSVRNHRIIRVGEGTEIL